MTGEKKTRNSKNGTLSRYEPPEKKNKTEIITTYCKIYNGKEHKDMW